MDARQAPTEHIAALLQLGFDQVGRWIPWTVKSSVKFELRGLANERVVYAFVVNGFAKYIGICEKNTTSLEDRMNRYKSLQGAGQNKRVAELILGSLRKGNAVEIWASAPISSLQYRGIRVDLVKGLENPLIDQFAPEWNR